MARRGAGRAGDPGRRRRDRRVRDGRSRRASTPAASTPASRCRSAPARRPTNSVTSWSTSARRCSSDDSAARLGPTDAAGGRADIRRQDHRPTSCASTGRDRPSSSIGSFASAGRGRRGGASPHQGPRGRRQPTAGLVPTVVQPEGRRPMTYADWRRGARLADGDVVRMSAEPSARRIAYDALRRIESHGAYAEPRDADRPRVESSSPIPIAGSPPISSTARPACDVRATRSSIDSSPFHRTTARGRFSGSAPTNSQYARIPPHAAVGETVALAPKRTRGFVNAVLRKLSAAGPMRWPSDAARLSYPDWLVGPLDRRARR